MNKKGFTLVEIVVCISLLAIIGVGSFVGIRMVNKKINIDKLNQITDKAVQAAQVYIETNKEATNQLYSNKNGVSLLLQLLVNEGLLNLDGTKLKDDDLKNQYVVTFLGGTGSSENCEQITSTTSWSNNKPIYLCMNSTTGSSNLATIDPTKYGNKTYVSNEPYYFKGLDPNNWIKVRYIANKENNNSYVEKYGRIYYIDRDDSIIITGSDIPVRYRVTGTRGNGRAILSSIEGFSYYIFDNEDISNSKKSICFNTSDKVFNEIDNICNYSWYQSTGLWRSNTGSVKITGGTGASNNPFTITITNQ